METSEQTPHFGTSEIDPLELVLGELQKIAKKAEKETFLEKYGIVVLPFIISLLIGLGTFYTSYRILEYKVNAITESNNTQNETVTETLKELKCDIGDLSSKKNVDEVKFSHINRRLNILERGH